MPNSGQAGVKLFWLDSKSNIIKGGLYLDFVHVNQKSRFFGEGVQDSTNLRSRFYFAKCKWSIMGSYGSVRVSKGQLGSVRVS